MNLDVPGQLETATGHCAAELAWDEKLVEFVQTKAMDAPEVKSRLQAHERRSNIDYLYAVDNLLLVSGLHGLQDFKPLAYLQPLDEQEEMYWVKDGAWTCTDGKLWPAKRPCIKNKTTGKKRWCLPCQYQVGGERLEPRRLHVHSDQGPVGWSALTYLYKDFKVNGALEPDKYHITHGDCKKALQASGLYSLSLATSIVMKGKRGPFGGAGHLGSLQDCVKHWVSCTSSSDPVFLHFYQLICADKDMLHDGDFGSKSHKMKIFDGLKVDPVLTNVGEQTKHARWFAWFSSMRRCLLQGWNTLALAVCVFGMYKGWWKGPLSMALLATRMKYHSKDDAEVLANDEGGLVEHAMGQSVKQSNEEVKLHRGHFSHTLQFGGLVLIDGHSRHLAKLACFLVEPVEEDQALAITECKTRRGTLQWYIDAANSRHLRVLLEVVDSLKKFGTKDLMELAGNEPFEDEVIFTDLLPGLLYICACLSSSSTTLPG